MALSDKRQLIIETWESKKKYLGHNTVLYDVYSGNLKPYLENIMRSTLSERYYQAILGRLLPINILERYIGKVSTVYNNPPKRTSEQSSIQEFVDFYSNQFSIDNSGSIIDSFSNLFKGYAWGPYIDLKGRPQIREIPFDRFFVISESMASPEEETIFVLIVTGKEDKTLFFAYTEEEFDAFWSDGSTESKYLIENNGINLIGTIPYVYGKRDKNRLYPIQDTDILAMTMAIPTMLSDGAGAQMFQAFSVLYGVDIESDNLVITPNAFWNFKSDKQSDKEPQVGVLKPQADTDKVVKFVMDNFTFWLETKGIRVGSTGQINGQNFASGVSKMIDEMDVFEIKKKSIGFYEKDESELWNEKMKNIHNYWINSQMVNPSKVPPLIPESVEMDVVIKFEEPKPIKTRKEKIEEIKAELDIGTMTRKQAIWDLHPEYSEEQIMEVLNNRELI